MQRASGDPADPIAAAEHEVRAAHDRVRRDLAALGRDTASAAPVPPEVTAAVHTALRAAPPHRVLPAGTRHHRHSRPPLDWRRAAAATGVLAAVLALGFGVFALADDGPDERPMREPGPTARHLTATRAPAQMPLTDTQIIALLSRPAELAALGDPQRCLRNLDYPADTPILGAAPTTLTGGPAVLLVLPGPEPASVTAVVVAPDCPAALARTVLARP